MTDERLDSAIAGVNQFLAEYLESQTSLWRSYVDPREALLGDDGEIWGQVGRGGHVDAKPYLTTSELCEMQRVARIISKENAFAINAHANRLNYVVGTGHTYTVVGVTKDASPDAITRVTAVLDQVIKANNWDNRQREILYRFDRDGEVFLRKSVVDGILLFRFVEPRSVLPPASARDHQSFGVETEPHDIESVIGYWIDGEPVDASEVQHRKANVDSDMKRGYPLMYPIRKNLCRAVKLLRNMSITTEIQTAIAMIRRHKQSSTAAVRAFVAASASDDGSHDGVKGSVLAYPAGAILDAPANTEYDIPKQMDPSKSVSALQAELRSIAAALVMPEFMLTSDASNSNFASTMIAEGPAVKQFESLQKIISDPDTELMEEALDVAVDSGLLSAEDRRQVCVEAKPPSVSVRNRLEEAQTRQIDMGLGILSPQTATAESGREYEQEQSNLEQHHEDSGGVSSPIMARPGAVTL